MQTYLSFSYCFTFLFTSKMVLRTCSSSGSYSHTIYTYLEALNQLLTHTSDSSFPLVALPQPKAKSHHPHLFLMALLSVTVILKIYKQWGEKQDWKKVCQCETPFSSCHALNNIITCNTYNTRSRTAIKGNRSVMPSDETHCSSVILSVYVKAGTCYFLLIF